jgi:hypothetical protein
MQGPRRLFWPPWIVVVPFLLALTISVWAWFQPVRLVLGPQTFECGRFNVGHKRLPAGWHSP